MAWRGMHISQAARLSLRKSRILLEPEQGESFSFPLEDIAYIILDTPRVLLSAALVAACAEAGCFLLTTDERHMPNGALLPFHAYHRQSETIEAQLALSQPRRKRFWQALVRSKIANQARALRCFDQARAAEKLDVLMAKVRSGDPGNVEALAARTYWQVFLKDFLRKPRGGDRANSLLDYGYAVVRAAVARFLAASGFWPSLGLHHSGRSNPFNLADDLIEPLRPVVDLRAWRVFHTRPDQEELDVEDRREMVGVLHDAVLLGEEEHVLLGAVRCYVEGIRSCIAAGGRDIPLLPQVVGTGE